MVHRCQLHARLVVDFTLTDIRTVKDVIVVVKAHESVLLLTDLLFLEIRAALTLVALHLLAHIATVILHQVRLGDVSVALRVRRRHPFAHGVVLGHVAPLFGSTTIHPVIIWFPLCAILRI